MIKPLLLNLLAIIITGLALAEGTRELRPALNATTGYQGSLLLMPSYSMFAIKGASAKQQLKILVSSVNEKIYFGFNNKNGIDAFGVSNDNGAFVPNVPFEIVSPSGLIVFSSVIPNVGVQGNIATWTQAVNGPKQLGNAAGYDAMQLSPMETGDYIIQFDLTGLTTRLNLHLFDITVALNNTPILGRLHSQGWQISVGSYSNPFYGKVYPYDGGTAVYEVNFNGMKPWVFVINFNSTGTGTTGNFVQDRQSKIGNYTYGEYEVFLNPPDETLFPTHLPTLSLVGTVVKKDCVSSDFCLDFTVNSSGDLEGFIDLNNDGIYEPSSGEVGFEDHFTGPGTRCIPWNGRDAFGNLVNGNFQVIAALGFGITHLPLYDVESNPNGYIVKIIRPSGSTQPVIFWDDNQITAGSALDGKVNQTGCDASITGCHKWLNRGSLNDPTALDQQETINTWWYSTIATTTALVSIPQQQRVQLSFDPTNLVQRDTTVCRGDSVSFYIYNDGVHFNLAKYDYEWTFNSNSLSPNIRQHREPIMQNSEVIIKATDKTLLGCVSYDTLHILVVDPVTLISQVTQPTCTNSSASIEVQLLSGPPNKQFYWQEFPGLNSGSLNNLAPGTYHLLAKDPAYPQCAADTAITITNMFGVIIDTVKSTGTMCNEITGTAEVTMQDMTKSYEYNWDNTGFSSGSTQTAFPPGSHTVMVRDIATGCTDQKPFNIPNTILQYSASSQNEICHNAQGSIALTLPSALSDFDITWNGTLENVTSKINLSTGPFIIHVQSSSHPACQFDTTITITNIDNSLIIESLLVQNSDCQTPTGSAQITTAPGNYSFKWDNGSFGSQAQMSNLAPGQHTILVQENSTACLADTTFIIDVNGWVVNVSTTNNICNAGTGSILISSTLTNTEVIWQDGSSASFQRSNLDAGIYSYTVRDINNHSCKVDGSATITDSVYNLNADFTYSILNPDSLGSKTVAFTNTTPNYQPSWTSFWTFGDGANSHDVNPVHNYTQDLDYTVKLLVVDSKGCSGLVSKIFNPFKITTSACSDIALPNVFSPNNDGMNDELGILGYAPYVELTIFNRWGEVIFRTTDVKYKWDGKYRGVECPVDVYPYILNWECAEDGNSKKYHKVNDITLVR